MPLDAAGVADAVYQIVEGYLRRSLAPALERLDEIGVRLAALELWGKPPQGKKGDPGEPGPPGESIAGPSGEKGEKGDPGESIIGPEGPEGPPGESIVGPAGPQGERGEDGVGLAAIVRDGNRLGFEFSDGRAFDAGELPRGEKGEVGPQGIPGRDGRDGPVGPSGERGPHGEKGDLGPAGPAGERGPDGFGFDDIEVEHDGERRFTLRFVRGTEIKQCGTFVMPVQIYRGVHVDGRTYERGDTVTWGGSLWHCDEPTSDKPRENTKVWTLQAKRGADGRHGKDGERGPAGPEGKAGRDLTHVAPDGSRW